MMADPLQTLREIDPELMSLVEESRKLAFSDGALSAKVKTLIALALDASAGATEGVKALAHDANRLGATDEEITETLRVAQFISGVGSLYTSSRALQQLREQQDGLG